MGVHTTLEQDNQASLSLTFDRLGLFLGFQCTSPLVSPQKALDDGFTATEFEPQALQGRINGPKHRDTILVVYVSRILGRGDTLGENGAGTIGQDQ